MALEGTIKDFGLADILQLIGLQRKTGTLTLEGPSGTVTVKFLDGAVVAADTSERPFEDLLGSVLVRTGRVTDAQLQESLRVQKSTLQRLGYILVKHHFISDADLEEALRIQVTQIVYRLFRWRAAKYHFDAMDHVEYDSEHFRPVSAETILMEGARMIDEWPMLERRIKSPTAIFKKTEAGETLDVPVASVMDSEIGLLDAPEGAPRGPRGMSISSDERDVLHMLDGRTTVQDLADTSTLAEFDLYRVLVDLLDRNLIEGVAPVAVSGVAPRPGFLARQMSIVLQALVFGLAAFGVASIPSNPLTPWRLAGRSRETELLRTYAGRNRVERIEQSVQAFYLEHGTMADTLEALCSAGYLAPADTIDPWGRPYAYTVDASAYEISGRGPEGRPDELLVRHAFTASQRMVLEGGAHERFRSAHP